MSDGTEFLLEMVAKIEKLSELADEILTGKDVDDEAGTTPATKAGRR